MSSPPSSPPKLLPWGRLVLLVQQQSVSLPDHFDLSRSKHCVGRVANRCDIHIPKQYISALVRQPTHTLLWSCHLKWGMFNNAYPIQLLRVQHCIIRLLGKDNSGAPLVEIEDQRYPSLRKGRLLDCELADCLTMYLRLSACEAAATVSG